LGLVSLCVLGGIYTLVASLLTRRYGAGALWATWLVAGVGIAIVDALRDLGQHDTGVDATGASMLGSYALLAGVMLVILSAPTLFVRRRGARATRLGQIAVILGGIACTFAGLLLSLVLTIVLTSLNIPLLRTH
jgi:hypothetical protein